VTQALGDDRLARLQAKDEIRDAIALYCHYLDLKRADLVADLFAEDGVYQSHDGVIDVRGRDEIFRYFDKRLDRLGATNHYTHDVVVRLGADLEVAHGVVNSHAEVQIGDDLMLAAVRYEDLYALEAERWRFQSRTMWFFYYCKRDELSAIWGSPSRKRLVGGDPHADFPENWPKERPFSPSGPAPRDAKDV